MAIGRGERATYEVSHVGNFVGRGDTAAGRRADSPDWLVGEDDFRNIFGRDFGKTAEELVTENVFGLAESALSLSLAKEKNWGDLVADGGSNGRADILVAFVAELTAFGMADKTIIDDAAELGAADRAGVWPKIAGAGGLGGETDLFAVGLERERLESDERRRDDYLNVAIGPDPFEEFMKIY